MNMLTSQLAPAPQYHNFVGASPTSAQPKSVVPQTRSPAGSLSKFIYDNQDNWMGKGLYGLVSEVITGVDPYTGVPVSRLEAATAFAFDVAGGEIFSFAGKGLSMVLAPGANASLGSVLMMGAKLQLGNLLESELATTVFSGVDSALIQPIKGLGQRVGVFGGARLGVESRVFKPGEDLVHFEKHGQQVATKLNFGGNYDVNQYVADANSVINDGIYVPELNGYVKIPTGPGSARAPFVGVDKATGEITTFHLKPVKFFEQRAPSLGWSAKPISELTDLIGANRELGWKSPYNTDMQP